MPTMLRRVLELLIEKGWLDASRHYEVTVYLSQGPAQSAVLTQVGRDDLFVKFSTLASLTAEAERCAQTSQRYPEHTAAFVGYLKEPPLEVLIAAAEQFRPINSHMLHCARDRRAIARELESLFDTMRSAAASRADLSDAHSWFGEFCTYSEVQLAHLRAAETLPDLASALPGLPAIPQHGDLVLNNLGLRHGGRLVVFDWEDYGAVSLPGLDLFTLEYSLSHDLECSTGSGGPVMTSELLDTATLCRALGLEREVYEQLKPAYALVFRYLKRNYGPDVRARFDSLATELRQIAAGKAPLASRPCA